MAHRWFVRQADKQNGPLSADQLRQLAATGQIASTDLVRRDDMTEWKQAGSVRGLFPDRKPTAPPPLPATLATEPVGAATTPEAMETVPSSQSPGEKLRAGWTSFLGTAKAAKDLTVAQGRRTKLSKFDLPAAYLALGKSVFESGSFRGEYADLFDRIEKTKAEIQKLGQPTGNHTPGTGFKEKVRAGAASLKAKGRQKALSVKLDSLHRELGQRAFDTHGESAGPQDVIAPVVRCHDQIESLDRETARLSETGKGKLLTPKRLAIGAGVVGVLLIGLLLLPLGSDRSTAEISPVGAPDFSDVDYSYVFSDVDFSNVDYDTIPQGAARKSNTRFIDGDKADYWAVESGYATGDGTFVLHGLTTLWFDQGKTKKRGEVHYLHGKRHGSVTYWYPNGQVETKGSYLDGEAHGIVRNWFEGGEKKSESTYVHGKLHGVNTGFFSSGAVESVGHFIEGKKHGVFRGFYEDDRKEFENYWVNDKRHGPNWKWSQSGELVSEKHFRDGLLHGPFRDRGMDGLRVGQWKDGEPVGKWTFQFTRYGSNERYEVETDASPWSGGTKEEFIGKMALLNLKQNSEAWMWPREGMGRCFASEAEFLAMFGKPDRDLPQRPEPAFASTLRIWTFRCSDGMLELRVAKNRNGGSCDFITEPYGQPR